MDFNGRNMKNAIQQQWGLLRKQDQKLPEATKFLQQTNLDSLTRSVAVEGMNSQQHLSHLQEQDWDLIKKKSQKMFLETNFAQQNHLRSLPRPIIVPGMCAQRFTQFLYFQKQRPRDNNIGFWRQFVAEFFTPDGKNRMCLSYYGDSNQSRGVFAQNEWNCEVCRHKPTHGFETTGEALPRLYKTKYDSGILEELFYLDIPYECQYSTGQVVLLYEKVRERTIFEKVHVTREGQLQIVFAPNLKICSWEFCVRRHEESIPKSTITPLVNRLGAVAQTYQNSARKAMLNSSVPELPSNCSRFVESATQLQKSFEVPMLNELGYTTKYMRCLQMSEVIHRMKALIDYNRETGMGPLEIYLKFSNKNLPTLRKNINNNKHPENNNAHSSDMDISNGSDESKGNSSATACVITDNGTQQNSLDSDNGSLAAQNPLGLYDTSSQGSNSSPENGTGDSNPTKNSVNVNENPATGTGSQLNEVVAPKEDDLDDLREDFDGKFVNENDLENALDDFNWSC